MKDTIVIREFRADEWRLYQDIRLRSLADSPDSFGSTYAESTKLPDEHWENRLKSGVESENDLPLVATIQSKPAGLAWGRIEDTMPEVAHLYQVWVAPQHRSKGIGGKLVEAVIAWAKARNARYLDLGVTTLNTSAVNLYLRYGFKRVGNPKKLRHGSDLHGQEMRLNLK